MFYKKLEKNVVIKKEFDKKAHDLPTFGDGDPVYFCDGGVPGWKRGEVVRRLASRSYLVKDERGMVLRRNRVHLRKRFVPVVLSEDVGDSLISSPLGGGFQQNIKENETRREVVPNLRSPRPQRTRRPPAWMRDYVAP